jgi:Cysteine-rich secretory protein family
MAPDMPDLAKTEVAIIAMTNAFRAENQLQSVRTNKVLATAAKAYAEYLARTGKFAHEADGRQPAERAKAAGYSYCIVAENLAMNLDSRGFETRALATGAVDGWKGSPPHRAAMLEPHVTEIGVGIAKATDKDPKFISVQLFGRPESLKYEFKIENHFGAEIQYSFANKPQALPKNAFVTHTACIPSDVTFDKAEPVARFKAGNGAVFALRRASSGQLRVDMNPTAAKTPE